MALIGNKAQVDGFASFHFPSRSFRAKIVALVCNLPHMRRLVETARKSAVQVAVECTTAYTSELLLALHRGKLDIAVVDLPIKSRGIGLHSIYSEALIAVLPQTHPLAQRPMVRLFELKKEQFTIIRRQIDPGSLSVEAMLRKAGIEVSLFCHPLI